MKVYRDLEILGDAKALKATLNGIKEAVGGTWKSVDAQEAYPGPPQHGFVSDKTPEHAAATVWLVEEPNRLYVSNIVPLEGESRLSADEYNRIAAEFCEQFVKPMARKTRVQVRLTDTDVTIEKWLDSETARLLHQFSAAANKSTGSRHPLDEKRWFAFLTAAHRRGTSLDGSTLARWLREEEGWPEDVAYELAADYEKAGALLSFYDQSQ